jgi:hypothetical protein
MIGYTAAARREVLRPEEPDARQARQSETLDRDRRL